MPVTIEASLYSYFCAFTHFILSTPSILLHICIFKTYLFLTSLFSCTRHHSPTGSLTPNPSRRGQCHSGFSAKMSWGGHNPSCLLSTYHMPGALPGALRRVFPVILTETRAGISPTLWMRELQLRGVKTLSRRPRSQGPLGGDLKPVSSMSLQDEEMETRARMEERPHAAQRQQPQARERGCRRSHPC